MNSITVMGRLTNDLEVKQAASGSINIISGTVAVDRKGVNKDGKEQSTDFINFRAFSKTGKIAESCGKGNRVALVGELRIDSYKTKEGKNASYTYILANELTPVDWKDDKGSKDEKADKRADKKPEKVAEPEEFDDDEDTPF